MKLSLTVWQRMTLAGIANGWVAARSVGELRQAIALAEMLEMTVAEKQAAGIFRLDTGQEAWPDGGGKRYELEIDDKQVALLRGGVLAFQQQQGWRAGKGKEALDLCAQLEIEKTVA